MAENEGMIEPFSPRQVRHVEGSPIISYGLSSYGYDIRCAGEFKVFTNVRSAIVDPKNFSEDSLWISVGIPALFHPIHLPWRVPWNISGFPAMCSPFVWVKVPTHVAALL